MKKDLAILINTYNSEEYIENLIKDIFSLEGFDNNKINIYIYDDCSNDSTIRIIEELSLIYPIKYIIGNENLGLFLARQQLLKNIDNEEFIIFIDADDKIDKKSLSEFYLNKNFCDVMVLKRKFIYKEKEIVYDQWYQHNSSNKIDDYFIYTHATYITGIFIKKEIYKNNLFIFDTNKKINLFEDAPRYAILVYLAKNIVYLNAFYLYNKKNSSSLLSQDRFINQYNSAKIVITLFDKWTEPIKDNKFDNIKFIFNVRFLLYMCQTKKNHELEFKEYIEKYLYKKNKSIKLNRGDKLNYLILKNKLVQIIYLYWFKTHIN